MQPSNVEVTSTRTPDRRGRGVALAATTIGVVLAAGVALVILQLTLGSTRLEAGRTDSRLAAVAAEQARIAFEDELAVAPLFFYSYVSELERARVCVEDDDAVYQPGSLWPAACGARWTYTDATTPSDVFLELEPPSVDEPALAVRILARSNARQVGMQARYVLDSTARYTLFGNDDLDLSALPGGATASLAGEFYTTGTIALGAIGYQTGTVSMAAEGGYTESVDLSPISDGTVRFYGPEDLSGTTAVRAIRELHPVPRTNLRALYPTIATLSCPAGVANLDGDGRSSAFCLVPGGALVDAAGALVAVPDATSFLLLPGVGGAGRLGVYWSATESGAPTACGDPCSVAAQSAASLGDDTHPGGIDYWTELGSFPVPASGLVYSSEDVHIGLCGDGFTGGGCTVWSGAYGVEADSSLTILAGTLLDAKDVYLSGPVTVANGVSFGAVATGQVLLPYWAATPAGTVRIGGSYTGLGVGEETAASVETIPAAPGAAANSALELDGTLAGERVDTSFPLFSTVALRGRDRHHVAPPPLYPASSGTWVRMATDRYTGFDRCGAATCND